MRVNAYSLVSYNTPILSHTVQPQNNPERVALAIGGQANGQVNGCGPNGNRSGNENGNGS